MLKEIQREKMIVFCMFTNIVDYDLSFYKKHMEEKKISKIEE